MKKISFTLMLPFLIFMLACSAWANGTERIKTHILPYGFSIDIPTEWKIYTTEDIGKSRTKTEMLFAAALNEGTEQEASIIFARHPNSLSHLNQESLKAMSDSEKEKLSGEYDFITRITGSYAAMGIDEINGLMAITVYTDKPIATIPKRTKTYTRVQVYLFPEQEFHLITKFPQSLGMAPFKDISNSFRKQNHL